MKLLLCNRDGRPPEAWLNDLRRALPEDAKAKIVDLLAGLHAKDPACAYGVAAGETAGFTPITHEAYDTIIEVRRQQGG